MSHHSVCAKSYAFDEPVSVLVNMGWDRALQGYYMYIESDCIKHTDDEGRLYDNLADVGLTPDLGYFLRKHIELKIIVPLGIVDGVIRDRVNDVVNQSKDWKTVDVPDGFSGYEQYYKDYL